MNLIFRLLRVLIGALLRKRIGLLETSTLTFRVWPTDLDLNRHMTNARYLSMMDLGRTDLLVRTGLLGVVLRARWAPVVGQVDIRFRRPLGPFNRFRLETRLLCWDEKWVYMEQRIEGKEGECARALVRGLFLGPHGPVPTREGLARLGRHGKSPPFPDEVVNWVAWEADNNQNARAA